MIRLLLVRHGQSTWNEKRMLQGQADAPLSALGRDQAGVMAPVVQALAPDRVLASDLKRTRQTAAILGYANHQPETALREIHVGDWTGRKIDALIAEDSDAYHGWRAGSFTPPGGESWADFRDRNAGVVSAVCRPPAERVLLVVHGGVIRALLEDLIDLHPSQIVPVGPASLTVLRLAGPGGRDGARLELFNYSPEKPVFDAPD